MWILWIVHVFLVILKVAILGMNKSFIAITSCDWTAVVDNVLLPYMRNTALFFFWLRFCDTCDRLPGWLWHTRTCLLQLDVLAERYRISVCILHIILFMSIRANLLFTYWYRGNTLLWRRTIFHWGSLFRLKRFNIRWLRILVSKFVDFGKQFNLVLLLRSNWLIRVLVKIRLFISTIDWL